jgi:hypothetical protein
METPKNINFDYLQTLFNKCEEARQEGKEPVITFRKIKKEPKNIDSLVQCNCGCWIQSKTMNTIKHLKSKRHLSGVFQNIAKHHI